MFSTSTSTAVTAALLLASSTVNAIPIWSRIAALAVRAQPSTPAEQAQGTNFFFDSLHLEDSCTTGQVACISSQLANCSPEGNWEITPCTGNNTCLAVPASDNTGVFVGCMLFADAQTLIGSDQVSVDFGVSTSPQGNVTGPAPIDTTSTESASDSVPTDTPTDGPTDSVPTDAPTATDVPTDTSEPTPTDVPTDSSAPTNDPTSTCTDDVPEPTETEYETITVVIRPDPTQSGEFTTETLLPTDSSSEPAPTQSPTEVPSPDVSGSDSAPTESPTCTEQPTETGEPVVEPTESSSSSDELAPTDPISYGPDPTDSISTESGVAPPADPTTTTTATSTGTTQETGQTLTVPPNFSLPTTTTATTPTPANNLAPGPSGTPSQPPAGVDISVIGTHPTPSPARARMMKVRRS